MISLLAFIRIGLEELKTRKGLLIFLIAVIIYYTWILFFRVEITWEAGEIINTSGGAFLSGGEEMYLNGYTQLYLLLLIASIALSVIVTHSYFSSEISHLLLTRPVNRIEIFVFAILSTTLIIWTLFAVLHVYFLTLYVVRDGVFVAGLLYTLLPLLGTVLAIVAVSQFFVLVSDSVFASFSYSLVLFLVIPLLLLVNQNYQMVESRFLLESFDRIHSLIPDPTSGLENVTDSLFQPPSDSLVASLPGIGLFSVVWMGIGYFVFRRKSY